MRDKFYFSLNGRVNLQLKYYLIKLKSQFFCVQKFSFSFSCIDYSFGWMYLLNLYILHLFEILHGANIYLFEIFWKGFDGEHKIFDYFKSVW